MSAQKNDVFGFVTDCLDKGVLRAMLRAIRNNAAPKSIGREFFFVLDALVAEEDRNTRKQTGPRAK